jgi:hypothetical protein
MAWFLWSFSGVLALSALALLYHALLADRPRGRRRCPRCWYDMAGTTGLACPECGKKARRERSLFRTRRRYVRAAISLLLAEAARILYHFPAESAAGRWWAAFPRPAQVAILMFYDDPGEGLLGSLTLRPKSLTRVERTLIALHCASLLARIPTPAPSGTLVYPVPPSPQEAALSALSSLGRDAWPAQHALIAIATDRTNPSRREVIRIIAVLHPASDRFLPLLANLMRDSSVCGTAIDAICDLCRVAAPQRGSLVLFLHSHSDAGNQVKVARLLRLLDGDAKAVQVYRSMLACDELNARLAGAMSCAAVRDAATIPDIITAIHAEPAPLRGPGVETLAGFGMAARPALLELLNDPDPSTVAGALAALGRVSHADAAAIAARAQDQDQTIAEAALKSLWEMGGEARSLVPNLRRRLDAVRNRQAAEARKRQDSDGDLSIGDR